MGTIAEIVLFHSALGLRPGVTAAADRLRAAGHKVHTPDYYEGEVFDDLDEGLRKCDALGYQEIARRAREAGGPTVPWTGCAPDLATIPPTVFCCRVCGQGCY